jgi:hypothetical protein
MSDIGEKITRKDILFEKTPDSDERLQNPIPPITLVNEYILGEMPDDLEAIRNETLTYEELRARHAALLLVARPDIEANTDEQVALVTQLGLGFMLGAYLPLEKKAYETAPPELLELLESQAQRFNLPRRMDYELIIDVNTSEYFRTGVMHKFLKSENSLGERDFYQGHNESEFFVKRVASTLQDVIATPDGPVVDVLLATAAADMKNFRQYMQKYFGLSLEAFGSMRPYLAEYPDGIRNASGAFMPSVQLAELALHKPTDGHQVYLDESMPYFPRWSRPEMADKREKSLAGRNIQDLLESGELELSEAGMKSLLTVVREFITFRTTHSAVTRPQIPSVFKGRDDDPKNLNALRAFGEPDILADGGKGTAGFDVVNVLGGATHRVVILLDELSEIYKRPKHH